MERKRARKESEGRESIALYARQWLRERWFALAVIGSILGAMLAIRSIPDIRRWWHANPDQRLAEFVLARDGTMVAGGSDKQVANHAGIPLGRFQIREVSLSNAKLGDVDLRLLAGRRDIEALDLSSNPLTDESLATLATMASLRDLDLTRTHVTATAVARLQRSLPKCKITARPDDNLCQWAFQTKIAKSIVVEVDLSSRSTRGRRKCLTLDELPEQSLTVIDADLTGAAEFDDKAALHLRGLEAIEGLLLDGTSITDESIEILVTLQSLKRLSVARTAVSDRGIERLRGALRDAEVVW